MPNDMELNEQDDSFVVAWMSCLNNFRCRRLALRSMKVNDVSHLTFESKNYYSRLNTCLKRRGGVCVVKLFGDECHWVFATLTNGVIHVFNTSKHYDMSDLWERVRFPLRFMGCSHLQRREDCFCQTWSIASVVATVRGVPPSRRLFREVVSKLWRGTVFRQWVRQQHNIIVSESMCGAARSLRAR